MKITEYIADTIGRLPKGFVFTYVDFMDEVESEEAVIKALNRMAASGKITKLSKGRFYKPEKSVYGKLPPSRYQVVKDLLEQNGKIRGYLTGYGIYNQLGLTTQVSNIIQIGSNRIRPGFRRAGYKISFILQKNTITKNNIPLLQILDSIRYVKKIPDTTISTACKRLVEIIKGLPKKEKETLVKLALKYPPAARALLGAILDETGNTEMTKPLSKTMNPITKYNLPGAGKVLSTVDKWNIK